MYKKDVLRSKLARSHSDRTGMVLDLKSDPVLPNIRKSASLRLMVSANKENGGRGKVHKLKNGGDLAGTDMYSERVMSLRSARTLGTDSSTHRFASLQNLQHAKSNLRTLKDLLDTRDPSAGPPARLTKAQAQALLAPSAGQRSVLASTEVATQPSSPKGARTGSWRKFVLTPPPVPEGTPPPEYAINAELLRLPSDSTQKHKGTLTVTVGSNVHKIQDEKPGEGEPVYMEGPEWKGGAVVKSEGARAGGGINEFNVRRREGGEGGGWLWLEATKEGAGIGMEEDGWEWDTRGLTFESRFESGNLHSAVRIAERKYKLLMRDDLSSVTIGPPSKPGARWFYFRISGAVKGVKYSFSLENVLKADSLFKEGLRPLVWSKVEHQKTGREWYRGGENVQYQPNDNKYTKAGTTLFFHSLSFDFVAPHDDDHIFFASCYPYTYTDLLKHLSQLAADPARSPLFVRRELAQSIAGNACDVLVVSSSVNPQKLTALRTKKAIVISARVHPGESNSSHVMQGVTEYLTSNAHNAQVLRSEYVLYLVPMLNPDGVINGNHRCSLSGQDLNRQWLEPGAKLHPTIKNLKTLLSELASQDRLALFCDLHGHSSRKGVFLYCCDASVSLLPSILARRSPFFALGSCTFKVAKSKQCTGRAVVKSQIGCDNSFTCEASMMGADLGDGSTLHFNVQHLKQMGSVLCDGIAEYLLPDRAQANK